MKILEKIRRLLWGEPKSHEEIAEAKRIEQDQRNVRVDELGYGETRVPRDRR
jgi:hypothetical protein